MWISLVVFFCRLFLRFFNAAIRYRSLHDEDYTSHYYKKRNIEDAYAIPVESLPCESTWDIPSKLLEPKLLSPDFKRQSGRPPLKRRESFGENKSKRAIVTCGVCVQMGHNKKTCSRRP